MPEAEPGPEPKPAPRLGSYLLVQALGSGGMSSVFRAVHEESGNIVAVKVLPKALAKTPTLLQRFMREAKSAEALDHPNIVSIYDHGFDQGRHYLVLEYVEGRDLYDRVKLNGPLGVAESIRFVREVAEGLRYAAGQGMIHRDIKPANLLMTPDGHAKIIDLGLALQLEDDDERVTRDGTTVGTVDYMAPEQARDSRQTSERSDIYSLGCTFYYLLSGSPPYPGGVLTDKLARHYKAPIPEIRDHRPDVPVSLSLLVRRMMEKRPERRYADYDQLIAALDALDDSPTQEVSSEPLDALILDDEDEDEIGLAPTESSLAPVGSDRPASSREGLLMAEIVDDDDEIAPAPTLPPPGPKPRAREAPTRPKPSAPAEPAELSLAELAAFDDPPPARRPTGPAAGPARPNPAPKPAQTPGRLAANPAEPILDDPDDEEIYGSEGAVRPSRGSDLPLKTWISAGVMVGLVIAIVAFGASMLLSPNRAEKVAETPDQVEPPIPEGEIIGPTPTKRNDGSKIVGPVRKDLLPKKRVELPTPAPTPEIVATPVVEPSYSAEWETKLTPVLLPRPGPPTDPKAKLIVRRFGLSGEENQFSSLAGAFNRPIELVEIADVGPFFEDNCQVAGKSRLIRGAPGFRPMIMIEYSDNELIKAQAAKFILGDKRVDQLTFEGIDFAVNVRDLPDTQTTLFLCQGADLIFRDCSLTILNADDPKRTRRFSIFRVEDGIKPNRIVFERTLIRGPVGTLVDVAASKLDLILSRSMILGDSSPLILAEAADRTSRTFHFYRSVLATRGQVLESSGRANPPVIRSLGTVFAKVEGPGNVQALGLFSSRHPTHGEPPTLLDWSGEDNEFIGWPNWLTGGPDGSIRVSGLDGIRSAWPGSDSSSRELTTPWPAFQRPDERWPVDYAELAPTRRATLLKIGKPGPRFRDLTFGPIDRLNTPKLSSDLTPNAITAFAPTGMSIQPSPPKPLIVIPPDLNASGPKLKNGPNPKKGAPAPKGAGTAGPPPPPGPLKLTFDLAAPPWQGDLGLFLAEKLIPGTPQATILVKGSGIHSTTPIRFADGLSIAILGESVEGSNLPMPTFVPAAGSSGRTMFELHQGDLAIANLGFSSGGARPLHWIVSEDGILALRHCWFRENGTTTSGVRAVAIGALIEFVARGTTPIPSRSGPLASATDRPTARLKDCLIWTAGEAIEAEVGRGVVDLENCMIISGGPAFTLLPKDVKRDQFEADLVLDHCTIAVDRTGVLLGPMAGESVGPTRPWLIWSRKCAFPRTQPAGSSGALLQVDPEAMARGVLFWQSSMDAYDSLHLMAVTGPTVASPPSIDLKKQWIGLWGAEHTRGDRGPTTTKTEAVLRYKEKPRPGKVVPAGLEVDKGVIDAGPEFKDIPTIPKGAAEFQAGRGGSGPRLDRP